jgi:hypothetical protein
MNEPTAPVLETTPEDDLYLLLTEELRTGVDEGRYLIAGPGQNDKPVVIDADTKRWVTGSGRPLNANDPAYIGKVTAYRRSKVFSEALEQLIPAFADDDEHPDAIISFQELIQAAKECVVGLPEAVDVTCPCGCGHEFRYLVGAKRDSKMIMFLIERLAGAANKSMTVNMHSEELIKTVSDSRVLHEIEVVSLTAEERAERRRKVLEA